MSNSDGDPNKQPPECKALISKTACPNIKNTYEGMDGERWCCDVCGESFFLDYEEMK
jgi:hypothetical protein